MADVFVSYKSHRRAAVEHLARVLELNGFSVWFDHALLAGEEFAPPIERELRAARAVIVAWCSLSIASDWVREEASLAKRLKTILPVRVERVDPPLGFATLHTIDLSRWDGAPRSHVIDRLVLEVGRLVGRDPTPNLRDLQEYDKIWRRSGAPTMLNLVDPAQSSTSTPRRQSGAPRAAAAMFTSQSTPDADPDGVAGDRGGATGPSSLRRRPAADRHSARGSSGATAAAALGTVGPSTTPAVAGGSDGRRPAHAGTIEVADAPRRARERAGQALLVADAAANSHQRRTAPVPPVPPVPPSGPSLVVLPFAIIGDDPEQAYFADGLTEELTAELARLRWFFVIARNSAFTYKGKAIDMREVGRELGVRYALEGSVRRAGRQVRIAGRLVDAETGHGIWAGRFDGDIGQIFELQDSITEAVAGALDPTLRNAEIERAQRKSPHSLDAYDLYLRALPQYHAMSEEGTAQAQSLLRHALGISPGYALAKSLFAACQVRRQGEGWSRPEEAEVAVRLAREAAAAAPGDPTVLGQSAVAISYLDFAHREALSLIDRALAICPNSALVEGAAGLVHVYACRPEPAIAHLHRAMRLSPLDPWSGTFLMGIATAHQIAGRLDDALATAEASIHASPNFGAPRRVMVATLAMMGRIDEARQAAEDLRRLAPAACHVAAERVLARNPDKAFATRLIEAYRAAGMPE